MEGLTTERAQRLARAIYAAARAKTPGDYREMQTDDVFGIEELFVRDVVELLAAEPAPRRREIDTKKILAQHPLYRRVSGLDPQPREELSGLAGDDEDEAAWAAAVAAHERKQEAARMAFLADVD